MYLTTKAVANLVGCSVRQLSYWRQRGIIVPTVNPSGTGYSAYYNEQNLVEVFVLHYLVTRGYDLYVASQILNSIKSFHRDNNENLTALFSDLIVIWDEGKKGFVVFQYSYHVIGEELLPQMLSRKITSLIIVPLGLLIDTLQKFQNGN